jgi:hypothetical protein
MTELHPAVRSALEALAPPFEHVPAHWEDALRRGAEPPQASSRRRVIAIALAVGAIAGLAASPFGQAMVEGTVSRLASWARGEPGEPASDEQQEAFQRANAASYASFPAGTKLRSLIRQESGESRFELLGFRDGAWLCLRLVRDAGVDRDQAASCASSGTLEAIEEPVAVVSANHRFYAPGQSASDASAVYGFVADGVSSVEAVTRDGTRFPAEVGSNVFLYVGSGDERIVSVVARGADGGELELPLAGFRPRLDTLRPEALPGPGRVEREVEATGVGWLEGGEERGLPVHWAESVPGVDITFARSVRPDPTGAFRLGVAIGEGSTPKSEGRWYCVAWQWPLVAQTGWACSNLGARFPRSHLLRVSEHAGGDQLPIETGVASDEVASLALFYADGTREAVALHDNVFAVQVRKSDLPGKLVAYDQGGAVIGIDLLHGHVSAAEEPRWVDRVLGGG